MKKLVLPLLIGGSLIVAVLFILYSKDEPQIFGYSEGSTGESWILRGVIGYGFTLLGVFLGSFYRNLSELKDKKQIPKGFFNDTLRSVDLWMGLISSPIVYILLLQSFSELSLSGLIAVALENGFCCLIVVNSFVNSKKTT